jgi:hypothetical protein
MPGNETSSRLYRLKLNKVTQCDGDTDDGQEFEFTLTDQGI